MTTGPRHHGRRWWATTAVVALTTVTVAEVLRTLYPLGYALVGDLGFVVTPLVLLPLFLTPLLAGLLRHAGGRGAAWTAIGMLVVARLGLEVLSPPTLWAAAIATAVALVAMTVLAGLVLSSDGGAVAVAAGVAAAIGLDVALKSAFAVWDRVWQPGVWPLVATVVVLVVLVVCGWLAFDGETVAAEGRGRGSRMAAVALLLMPAMLLFGSPGFVVSSSGLALPVATFVLVAGSAVAMVCAIAAASIGEDRRFGVAAGLALATVAWGMTTSDGAFVAVLAVAGELLTAMLLVVVLAAEPSERHRSLWRTAGGATAGFVGLFALTLLYPMHYEMPLPLPNTLLPAAAVALAMLALLARREGDGAPMRVEAQHLMAAGLGLGALGAVVAVWLAGSAAHRPVTEASLPLTVATFNIDQGLTADGAVDFQAVAAAIDGLDADVVALQEVGRGWSLSGMNDFAAWHRQTQGTEQYFAPAADRQFGNLLLSTVELRDVRTLELPKGSGSMNRSAIVAVADTADGPVTIYAVHLQHRNSAGSIAAREAELAVLLDDWAGAARTIVMGDFNANNQRPPGGGAKVLEGPDQANTLQPLLDAGFTTTQSTTVCEVPTSNDNCSDFVLATGDLAQAPGVEVLPEAGVGDHHPVRAVIVLS